MDWKREAADKLRCYEAKKTSIDRAMEEIHRRRPAIPVCCYKQTAKTSVAPTFKALKTGAFLKNRSVADV